jgi:prevent-host-death family protein
MKQVGIFEAKTHLSSLLDGVEAGTEVVITRHGRPIARLVAAGGRPDGEAVARRRAAWRELNDMGRSLKLGRIGTRERQEERP